MDRPVRGSFWRSAVLMLRTRKADAGRVVGGEEAAFGEGAAPEGLQLAERLLEGVVEVVVDRLLEDGEGDLNGFGGAEEAGGADGFEADAGVSSSASWRKRARAEGMRSRQ
jgi:hypothetical protein